MDGVVSTKFHMHSRASVAAMGRPADLARSCNDVRKCSFWWLHRFTISRGVKRYWLLEKLND